MTAMPLQPFTAAETARLARIETAEPVDAGQDARIETVARALWEDDNPALVHVYNAEQINDLWRSRPPGSRYERLAVAALAAMHPADETLRAQMLDDVADEQDANANHVCDLPQIPREHADRLRAALGGEQ